MQLAYRFCSCTMLLLNVYASAMQSTGTSSGESTSLLQRSAFPRCSEVFSDIIRSPFSEFSECETEWVDRFLSSFYKKKQSVALLSGSSRRVHLSPYKSRDRLGLMQVNVLCTCCQDESSASGGPSAQVERRCGFNSVTHDNIKRWSHLPLQ